MIRPLARLTLGAALAALLAAAPAEAAARLTIKQARGATRVAAIQIAAPFTESQPRVTVTCKRTSTSVARCRARIGGDRITATFTARVRAGARTITVYAGRLQTS
jgi:hypothetical protein